MSQTFSDRDQRMGSLFPHGTPPFELAEAQQATAIGQSGNRVALTLYCVIKRRVEPEPIQVKMTSAMAVQLAEQLLRASANGA